MSKTVHSVKLIPYDSIELDQLSYANGDVVYDSTNATLRLMNGFSQSGTFMATQPWIENSLTTLNNTIAFTNIAQSLSSSSGAVTITGGVGIAKNVNIGGDVSIGQQLNVTGAAHLYSTLEVDNDFSVNTNKFTVDHTTGNAYLAGTLRVVAAATFNNTLEVDNDFSVNTNKFTVNHTTGNTSIAGTLQVTNGVTAYNGLTLSGNTTPATEYFIVNNGNSTTTFSIDSANGNSYIAGTLEVDNDFSVNTNKFTVDHTTGNTVSGGTLQVTGATTLNNTLEVDNDFSVNTNKFTVDHTTGNTLVAGTLTTTSPNITTGITSPSATFNLVNTTPTTVNFAGNATTINIGAVTGTTYIKNNFNVAGNTVNAGTMEVDGNFQVGTTSGGKAFTVNANTGNVVIQGSLTTYGTNYQIGSVSSISGPLTTVHSGTFNSNDGNDIGVLFNYYDTTQKNGFFGFQNSTQNLVYYLAATNTSGVFGGTFGNIQGLSLISSSNGAIQANGSAGITTNQTSFNLVNSTATNISFAGAATTLAIGNTTTAGQTVNMFTSANGTSTYNFATGPIGNGNTNSINIGTGGSLGSTTNITLNTGYAGVTSVLGTLTAGTIGGAGSTTNFGVNTGNTTLNIYGNGTSGTATLTTNVTTGTINLFTSVTGTINIGGSGNTLALNSSTISTNVTSGTLAVFNSGLTGTLNLAGAANTINIGAGGAGSLVNISGTTTASTATATPLVLNLGSTYSSSAGANPKLKLWTDGSQSMGIGVSSNQMDFIGTSGVYQYGFWTAGTKTFAIDTSGNGTFAGTMTSNSDASLKTNVVTIVSALDKVDALRGVMFDRISTGKREMGVIAQEVEAVIPELVFTDANGVKSVAYANTVALLIEAIKELKSEITDLKSQK